MFGYVWCVKTCPFLGGHLTVTLKEGDVVLLDNYRVLHGRNTFKGDRKHAVTWFESCGEPLANNQKQKPDDFMNELINKTLV